MKLELTLMELNDLYYGANKVVVANREILENVPGDAYWTKQVENAELLANKLMDAIIDECAKLDEARNYVLSMQQAHLEDRLAGNI
jgi:hypothetical protein